MEILYYLLIGLTLATIDTTNASDKNVIISLKNPSGSLVQGHLMKTHDGNDMYAFQEIPYAEPPVGERRFQLPVRSKGWKGIIRNNATRRVCIQKSSYFHPIDPIFTEDCLVLNIYTPTNPNSNKKHPVMVWIHGGGFISEGGTFYEYNPQHFIDEQIVVVTLNYRLGPIGFLNTGDGVIPANLGLHDQLLALEWVHDNIDVFGGDSSNVVIGGESAGGASVGWHLIGSKPTNLFTGAIMASGSALCPFAYNNDVYRSAVNFVKTIDPSFEPLNSTSIRTFLQKATTEQLKKALELIVPNNYLPVKGDGDNFAEYPTEAYDNGLTKRVPIMMGYNSEESLGTLNNEATALGRAKGLDQSCVMYEKYSMHEDDRKKACLELKRLYTNVSFQEDLPAYLRYYTDEEFTRPMFRALRSFSKYVKDVFLYQFSYKTSVAPQRDFKGIPGVGHADDLDLLVDRCGSCTKMTEIDFVMSKRLVRLWSNFIRYRNPTPFPEKLLDNITWPRVTPNKLTYLDLNTNITVSANPRNSDKWLGIMDKYLQHPITIY